jgi:hypothetical protein
VILAVVGAFLNSGDLLAEFQPDGRAWVGYIAAASVGVGLYLCVEALLRRPHWSVAAGVIFFGLAEVSGQVLHAALVRSDVAVMTELMRWIMGYVSPSLVVVSGIVMAFVVQYGFPRDATQVDDLPITRADLARLEQALQQPVPVVPLADVLNAAQAVDDPDAYVIDANNRLLRRTNGRKAVTADAANTVKQRGHP